ncbi:hypothetical protein RN001_006260 [Aquatica leii]|uniref:Uncharacterized protein n=1 Tax=Aquatica leii TaxID=1421715 RepID=A0AAN7PIB6_9COLE|nr:hypothetical protein RN001_006260 [Aquatica leii]
MSETVSVSVSAIAFSFISYENVKFNIFQEGFLLGDLISKETNQITDAEHQVVNKQKILKIRSVIPCPHQCYFYDAAGKIDKLKVKGLLGNQQDKVIGWYIFKHKNIPTPKLLLREKIIHKHLAELFQFPLSYFTSCLLTLKSSNTNATFTFTQTFLRYHMCKYDILPLHVTNLGIPNYKFESAEPMPSVLVNVVKNIKCSDKLEGHLFIQKIQDGLQSHMKTLVEKSIEKEEQLFKLEQEIKQLKQSLMLNEQFGKKKNNLSEKELNENGVLQVNTTASDEPVKKRRGRAKKNLSPQNKCVTRNSQNVCDSTVDSTTDNSLHSLTKKSKLNINNVKK